MAQTTTTQSQATKEQRSAVRDYRRLRRLARVTDKRLLQLVRDGRPAFAANGEPITNDSGAQVMKPPSAADLQAAIRRLDGAGVTIGNEDRITLEGKFSERLQLAGIDPAARLAEYAATQNDDEPHDIGHQDDTTDAPSQPSPPWKNKTSDPDNDEPTAGDEAHMIEQNEAMRRRVAELEEGVAP